MRHKTPAGIRDTEKEPMHETYHAEENKDGRWTITNVNKEVVAIIDVMFEEPPAEGDNVVRKIGIRPDRALDPRVEKAIAEKMFAEVNAKHKKV